MTDADKDLPLPVEDGGPERPFGEAVDAYTKAWGVTRQECFRRISSVTGNSVNGLATRYKQRPQAVWQFSAAGWRGKDIKRLIELFGGFQA